MSYVEILILRRLRSGPAHGYELRKRVEETTGVVLHNNSLYPALRRFEEAGAVTKAAEPQDGQAADPGEFMARLGQFSLINSAERASVLASRTRAVHAQLAHYRVMH